MPTYLSPGVYIQELDAATRPIEGVGTAVAAFVGFAPRGPKNSPTLVTNWTQYVDQFGDIETGSYLALAVYGYFLNGGGRCYIVRIGAERPESQGQGKQPSRSRGPRRPRSATTSSPRRTRRPTPRRSRSRSRRRTATAPRMTSSS